MPFWYLIALFIDFMTFVVDERESYYLKMNLCVSSICELLSFLYIHAYSRCDWEMFCFYSRDILRLLIFSDYCIYRSVFLVCLPELFIFFIELISSLVLYTRSLFFLLRIGDESIQFVADFLIRKYFHFIPQLSHFFFQISFQRSQIR